MTREDFLTLLADRIAILPTEEKNKVYEYYNEIILDKQENGLEEDTIIAEFGDVDEIAAKILSEYPSVYPEQAAPYPTMESTPQNHGSDVIPPPTDYSQPPVTKKRSGAALVWLIILLVFASPLLLSLALAGAAVLISLLTALAALIISFWAVAAALILSGVIGAGFSLTLFSTDPVLFVFDLGISILLTGLGVLAVLAMISLTRLSIRFVVWMFRKMIALCKRKPTAEAVAERS